MYIIGAGGHGKIVAEIVELLDETIYSFIDENSSVKQLWEYPVIHEFTNSEVNAIIAIGDNQVRKRISERYKMNFISLFHPFSQISPRSFIAEGTVIVGGVIINANAIIGKHVIVNTNSSVGHDVCIEDYVHIAPNVALAGHAYVGEGTFVGMGASVLPGVKIGKWCTVGAGSVVLENVPDRTTVVGNPARVINEKTYEHCNE